MRQNYIRPFSQKNNNAQPFLRDIDLLQKKIQSQTTIYKTD